MGRVADKVAIVTGGASGIGRATAILLAQEDATIIVADRDQLAGEAVVSEIEQFGGVATYFDLDVRIESRWRDLIRLTLKQHKRLDILFNNAGVQKSKTIEDATLDDLRFHLQVNLEGVFLGTKYAIECMKENQPIGGSIINTASVYGLVGEAFNAPYCASKSAICTFTKSTALHCGRAGYKIRVNNIHPGTIVTPMVEQEAAGLGADDSDNNSKSVIEAWRKEHPIGRLGTPLDIAYAVLYLASDESTFVTGSDLVVDGGYTAQ